MTSSRKGFTLLELLVTLAIISLLIMVSYPVYTQHTLKARRAHAEVALLNLAAALEQYHVRKNTYVGATFADLQVNEYTDNQAYRLEMDSLAENNYWLKAIPQKAQEKDTLCGVLGLDASGKKSAAEEVKDCW